MNFRPVDIVAASAAMALTTYCLADGADGHALLQVGILLAGTILIAEELAALLDEVLDRDLQ